MKCISFSSYTTCISVGLQPLQSIGFGAPLMCIWPSRSACTHRARESAPSDCRPAWGQKGRDPSQSKKNSLAGRPNEQSTDTSFLVCRYIIHRLWFPSPEEPRQTPFFWVSIPYHFDKKPSNVLSKYHIFLIHSPRDDKTMRNVLDFFGPYLNLSKFGISVHLPM